MSFFSSALMLAFTQLEASRKETKETAEREICLKDRAPDQSAVRYADTGIRRYEYDLYGQDKKSDDAGI